MWNQVEQALNESASRIVTGVANLLPGFVALTVALLISILVAAIVGFLLRRSLRGIDFDAKAVDWGLAGLAEFSPSKSPTVLVVRFVSWTIILVGFPDRHRRLRRHPDFADGVAAVRLLPESAGRHSAARSR